MVSPDEILPGDWNEEIAIRQIGIREIRVVYEEIGKDTVIVYTVISRHLKEHGRGR